MKKKIQLEKEMQERLVMMSKSEFAPLVFSEIIDSLKIISTKQREIDYYREHPQVLANQLAFLAREAELLANQ